MSPYSKYSTNQLRRRITRFRAKFAGAISLTPAFIVATLAAYWLRFESSTFVEHFDEIKVCLPLAVGIKIVVFGLFRMTKSWHDYVSFPDLLRLGRATAVAAAFLALADSMYRVDGLLPRSIIVIDACLTGIFVGGMLSARRMLREWKHKRKEKSSHRISVLIVGLNETGESLLRAIRNGMEQRYRVAGIVAKRERLIGREINGVPVVATLDRIVDAAKAHDVEQVFVVGGELATADLRNLVQDCQEERIKVRVLPSVEQVVSGQIDFRPREVDIEDLLGREAVSLDQTQLRNWLTDRALIVTGSCGSIGSEIARQLLKFGPRKLILVDRSETGQFHLEQELQGPIGEGVVEIVIADINDKNRMQEVIKKHQPSVMFHAAAYKHVPLMEQHPGEAVRNITQATCGLADLAHLSDLESFVLISTDKAVNPTSVMGCCKRVAELYIQAKAKHSSCRFVTVRFGNVLGSAGSVIPTFKRQIMDGGPVTVTHPDMTRYFMTIPEASQLVIQAGAMGKGGEIFVLDMGSPVRIVDLAEDLIKLSGLKLGQDIEVQFTGLRPGEKMYEELYIEDEKRCPTLHPKILVAESEQIELARVMQQIDELIEAATRSPLNIRGSLKNIVPRYNHEAMPQRKVA